MYAGDTNMILNLVPRNTYDCSEQMKRGKKEILILDPMPLTIGA